VSGRTRITSKWRSHRELRKGSRISREQGTPNSLGIHRGAFAEALRIKPGDSLEGNRATIRVHPGIRSLKGVLASNMGKGVSFAQIREAAAEAARLEGIGARALQKCTPCSPSRGEWGRLDDSPYRRGWFPHRRRGI
jgi:hypothetical protein